QPVGQRDLVHAQRLLQRPRVARTALDRRVVGDEQALHAGDEADAGDDGATDGEVGPVAGEGGQLEEGGVQVEQQLDTFAGGELAAVVVPLDVRRATPGDGPGDLDADLGEGGVHGLRRGPCLGGARVERA